MKLLHRKILDEIRGSRPYKKWRTEVLERDKSQCVLCGSKEQVEADHIKALALHPWLAFQVENGRTLCKECHKKTDTYGSMSRFKQTDEIHPALRGNLFYKINSLPSAIQYREKKDIGLSIFFDPLLKEWKAGYKFARIKILSKGKDIEEAVDNLYEILKYRR